MNLDQFIAKWNGKQCEVAGSANAKNQCVDLANAYIRDVLNKPIIEWTNAKDFPSKANDSYIYIKNTVEAIPQKGDLIIWNGNVGGGAGHIAICISATQGTFQSFDQNWSVKEYCKIENHKYNNVDGWLRAKEVVTIDLQQRVTDLEKEVLDKNKQIKGYEEQVGGLNIDLGKKDKVIEEITGQLKTANDTSEGYLNEIKTAKETLSNTFDCKPEWAEIYAKATEGVSNGDKADKLDRKLALEVKEHQADVILFGKEIESLKAQLASLEIKYKELKDTQITPTQPTTKLSIIDIIKKVLGI